MLLVLSPVAVLLSLMPAGAALLPLACDSLAFDPSAAVEKPRREEKRGAANADAKAEAKAEADRSSADFVFAGCTLSGLRRSVWKEAAGCG